MLHKIVVLLGFLGLAGCTTMMDAVGAAYPGKISADRSGYDGVISVRADPGWAAYDGSTVKVGAWKNSKMAPDEAILIVRNDLIKHFSPSHPNVYIKIDGKESKLSPDNPITECVVPHNGDVSHCYQEYTVKMAFIEELANGKDVMVKILLRNSYIEGSLKQSGPTTARNALRDFLAKVKTEIKAP